MGYERWSWNGTYSHGIYVLPVLLHLLHLDYYSLRINIDSSSISPYIFKSKVGGLIFSYYASPYFDSNIKEFRLFADVINDVGLALDMIAPHVQRSRLLMLTGTSTLCRFMCGAAAGRLDKNILMCYH